MWYAVSLDIRASQNERRTSIFLSLIQLSLNTFSVRIIGQHGLMRDYIDGTNRKPWYQSGQTNLFQLKHIYSKTHSILLLIYSFLAYILVLFHCNMNNKVFKKLMGSFLSHHSKISLNSTHRNQAIAPLLEISISY